MGPVGQNLGLWKEEASRRSMNHERDAATPRDAAQDSKKRGGDTLASPLLPLSRLPLELPIG